MTPQSQRPLQKSDTCSEADAVNGAAAVTPLSFARNGCVDPEAYAASRPVKASYITIDDWDALYHAVEARLTRTVGVRQASLPEPLRGDAAGRVQVIVLECVDAMERLHEELIRERTRSQQFEQQALVAQTALAQFPSEQPHPE